MPPNQPDRMQSARDGIERDFAFERFVSQGLSLQRRYGRCRAALPRLTGFPRYRVMISSNSSEVVGDRPIKTAALTKLRRTDTNAAAVAQLINLVE